MEKALTTTSYAILGWLAVRPWPMYELSQQTRRNLRFFWPRAESGLYDEAKRLARRGLARAEESFVGKRRRTTYSITAKGRRALAAWLGEPSAPPALEFEALVRVFFAGAGTREQLRETLAHAADLGIEVRRVGRVVADEFVSGRHPFPERIHLSALILDFLWGFGELLERWARTASAEVGQWERVDQPDRPAQARARFQRALAQARRNARLRAEPNAKANATPGRRTRRT